MLAASTFDKQNVRLLRQGNGSAVIAVNDEHDSTMITAKGVFPFLSKFLSLDFAA